MQTSILLQPLSFPLPAPALVTTTKPFKREAWLMMNAVLAGGAINLLVGCWFREGKPGVKLCASLSFASLSLAIGSFMFYGLLSEDHIEDIVGTKNKIRQVRIRWAAFGMQAASGLAFVAASFVGLICFVFF